MRKLVVILFLMQAVSLLMGQPVDDTTLVQKRIEAVRLPDMNLPRAAHNVFYVDGELTVMGGHTLGFVMTPTAEYFSEGQWHLMNTVYAHDDGTVVTMDEGRKVLLVGGHERNLGIGQSYEAELYYPETHSFEGFGCLDHKRALAQGVELDGRRALIVGNHQGNDAFEVFDGQKFFHHVKDIVVWRAAPYLFPVADEEFIVFGAVWRDGRFQPCDTVDRLKGEPFRAPVLGEWMPFLYDQNNHALESFTGDEAAGDYSYLFAAHNCSGEVAFIQVRDTVFSLLPIQHPVPTETEWGAIKYDRSAIVDPQAHSAYLVGNDTTGRAYVVAVEYSQCPATLTLFYTDPLEDFGNTTPVLTPDGNLIVTGGITDDNFAPFSTVWLLPVGGRETTMAVATVNASSKKSLWWIFGSLLLVAIVWFIRRFASLTPSNAEHLRGTKQSKEQAETEHGGLDCHAPLRSARNDEDSEAPAPQPDPVDNELMTRIKLLMEEERLYLNPNLKLADVAEALDVSRNAVSACINALGSTFSQLVNDYRLQHAKELLLSESGMKMTTIGLESGFANERSFFRVFKEATGMTPKEWIAQQTASK